MVIRNLLIISALTCVFFPCKSQNNEVETRAQDSAQQAPTVKWYTFEEALALNAKSPRPILMDVFTEWCGWCKVLDRQTFSHPVIAQYLNRYFYPVKFDAEQRADVVYHGKTFTNSGKGARSAHNLIVTLLQGNLSYPTIIFFDAQSRPLTYISGFQQPWQLEPILVFIFEGHLQAGENFDTFVKSFNGKIKVEK